MKLSVLKKNLLIQQIDLGKDVLSHDYSETVFLIGRSKDCHIVLEDKKISREHARVIHLNGQWFIEKTDSENKCTVNGEEFNRHELEVGDVVNVDKFTIEVTDLKYERTHVKPVDSSAPNVISHAAGNVSVKHEEDDLFASDKNNKTNTNIDNVISHVEVPMIAPAVAEEVHEEYNKEFAENAQGHENYEHQDLENLDGEVNEFSSQELIPDENQSEFGEFSDDNLPYASNDEDSGFDEGTVVLQSFVSISLELFGDSAPYDRFTVDKSEIFIGRDASKCQIVLNDSEVSSVHAVLRKNNTILVLEDLNSSNGTLYKGDRINKVTLDHNDEFVIGSTAFTVKFRSDFLKEENSTLMPVDEHQMIEVEEIIEIPAEEGDEEFESVGVIGESAVVEKSIIKRIMKDPDSRKKAIYVIAGLALCFVLFYEEKPEAPKEEKKKETKEAPKPRVDPNKKVLSDEQMRAFSALYEIGKEHFQNGRYREALAEFQKIAAVDPHFNSSLQSMIAMSKSGLSRLEELEREAQAKIVAEEKRRKVEALLVQAREYTKDRRVDLAFSVFNDIVQLDPENFEVARLRMELEDWKNEQQRKALEEAQKKKDREDKISKLKPAKALYLQKEWFQAIGKLQEFLEIKEMDEDLTIEATDMLKDSKNQLEQAISPLVGKARSLAEGQDLKGAYAVYQQILKLDPSHVESLNQTVEIKELLTNRARKIYREAIISESLGLFSDAKEKFQEVQQLSPVDSDYYVKATEKLKNYLD